MNRFATVVDRCPVCSADKPEHHRKLRADYYIKNREKIIAWTLARKIAKSHSSPTDQEQLRSFYIFLKTADSIACYWCGKNTGIGERHGDHIVPISRDGKHEPSNLCCACVKCNTTKKAMLPEEFHGSLVRE